MTAPALTDPSRRPGADQRIIPSLWFAGDAEEGGRFYEAAIPGARIGHIERYPTEGLLEFQQDLAGEPLTVDVELPDLRITLINAGDEFRPNPSAGFMLTFSLADHDDPVAALDATHAALSDAGRELMPLGEYPFAPRYAWVEDRYGVSWQLMLAQDAADAARGADGHGQEPSAEERQAAVISDDVAARPFAIPALMFCGDAQNRCREAIDHWIGTFAGSRWVARHEYPQQTGPAPAGAIMFSEAVIAGQTVTAMDSGVEQPFGFTEGFSLMVAADGQDEIDRLWHALSAVPAAEQCGWCKDRFGLSWQIVPANLAELMSRPGAYEKLMGMTKIVIDEF